MNISDCLPGSYIVCIYDDGWFTVNVWFEISDQNQDFQIKFIAKSLNDYFNWSQRENICWATVSPNLCTFISFSVPSTGPCGYCLTNSEFNSFKSIWQICIVLKMVINTSFYLWSYDDIKKFYDPFLAPPVTWLAKGCQ